MMTFSFKKLLSVVATTTLFTTVAFAAGEDCKVDADCKVSGEFCYLAVTPTKCSKPRPTGDKCKRDTVCESKQCVKPAGKDAGTCK